MNKASDPNILPALSQLELTPAQAQNPRYIDTLTIGTWLIGKSEKTKKTYQKVIRQFFCFTQKFLFKQQRRHIFLSF